MMKTRTLHLATVLAMLAAGTSLSLQAQDNLGQFKNQRNQDRSQTARQSRDFQGEIEQKTRDSIVVDGKEVRLTLGTEITRGGTLIHWRELEEGDRVQVRARRENGGWVASSVELRPQGRQTARQGGNNPQNQQRQSDTDTDWVIYQEVREYAPLTRSPRPADDMFRTRPMSDFQIQETIENELFWSPYVNDDRIQVVVENGKATLSGTVDEWSGFGAAIENAFEGGAWTVRNQLQVRGFNILNSRGHNFVAARQREGRAPMKSDLELRDDVLNEIFWSPLVNDDDVRVSVNNGTVTLRGIVDDWDSYGAAVENAFEGGATVVRNLLQHTWGQRVQVVAPAGSRDAVGGAGTGGEFGGGGREIR